MKHHIAMMPHGADPLEPTSPWVQGTLPGKRGPVTGRLPGPWRIVPGCSRNAYPWTPFVSGRQKQAPDHPAFPGGTNRSLLVRGSVDDTVVGIQPPSEEGCQAPVLVFTVSIWANAVRVPRTGFDPVLWAHRRSSLQARAIDQDIIIRDALNKCPSTPYRPDEHRSQPWQAKATINDRPISSVDRDASPLAGRHIKIACKGLRPHAGC
jgi:hypothetical protein